MKRIIFSEQQTKNIINLYQKEKQSMKKIGEQFNVSRTVIKRILLENNIAIQQDNHKYKANYSIFENIDTAEKAYWLGFLAADGCNYQRSENASIIINIHQKDKEHLEKFLSFCDSNVLIQEYSQNFGYSNQTPMCKIVLNSKKMSEDLADKGIIPNKSLVLKPPKIQKNFYLPFILGYFDGDGSINKTSQYNNYSISIQGTKEILEWIKKVLNWDTKLEQRNQSDKNSFYIRCGGTNKPYMLLKKCYDSSPIYLERKYKIYKELEQVVLNRNIK